AIRRRGRRRRGSGLARRQHGAHTTVALARLLVGGAAIHGEHIGQVVVDDDVARDAVAECATAKAPQFGFGGETHVVGFAAVFNGVGFAFYELFWRTRSGIALLTKKSP